MVENSFYTKLIPWWDFKLKNWKNLRKYSIKPRNAKYYHQPVGTSICTAIPMIFLKMSKIKLVSGQTSRIQGNQMPFHLNPGMGEHAF